MKYYVLRISGYGADQCDICQDWEREVNSSGGFVFGEQDIVRGTKPNQEGRTNLFHQGCRCTLTPAPDGIPIVTSLDKRILLTGALGHIYFKNKTSEERLEMLRKYDDV